MIVKVPDGVAVFVAMVKVELTWPFADGVIEDRVQAAEAIPEGRLIAYKATALVNPPTLDTVKV